jgi:hypothetical protein
MVGRHVCTVRAGALSPGLKAIVYGNDLDALPAHWYQQLSLFNGHLTIRVLVDLCRMGVGHGGDVMIAVL